MIKCVNDNILIEDVKEEKKESIIELIDMGRGSPSSVPVQLAKVISFSKETAQGVFSDIDTTKDVYIYYNTFATFTPFPYEGKDYKLLKSNHVSCIKI